MDKSAVRAQTQTQLQALTPAEKQLASEQVITHIQSASFISDCQSIAGYAPLGSEPDLTAFYESCLAAGKSLYFPKYTEQGYQLAPINSLTDLQPGYHNVLEPTSDVTNAKVDVWLIPGVVFDLVGTRVGRGKGFYDRLLSGKDGLKCGICFHSQVQILPIPNEPHDIAMDVLISNQQMYITMGL